MKRALRRLVDLLVLLVSVSTLLFFALRSDEKEVEDDENQNERQEAHERIGLAGGRLGPGVGDEEIHGDCPS